MQRSVIDRGNRMPQVSNVEVVSYRCVCVEDSEGEGLRWRRQQRVKSAAMCVGSWALVMQRPKNILPRTCCQYCFFCTNNLFCNFKID
jgi:hypothetical protein